MMGNTKKQTGFTIVELLIVIVVIGILAAITIVAYGGIQDRAKLARAQGDLRSVNTILQVYYAQNGAYPVTGTYASPGWRYSCSTGMNNFIIGLTVVSSNVPQAPCSDSGSTQNDTWLYSSDGIDYKLIHIRPGFSATAKLNIPVNQRDTRWSSNGSWGYWTDAWAGL